MKRIAIILAGIWVFSIAAIAENQQDGCVTKLKGLTTLQIEKINQLEDQHQQVMDNLRNERRSTINGIEKNEIRAKMLDQKETHHNQLKAILTAEQWSEFESLQKSGSGKGQGRYASANGNENRGCQNCGKSIGQKGNTNKDNGNKHNKKGNFRNNKCRANSSYSSNIDTSQYHADNFDVIDL